MMQRVKKDGSNPGMEQATLGFVKWLSLHPLTRDQSVAEQLGALSGAQSLFDIIVGGDAGASESKSNVEAMSVRELKRALDNAGVRYDDCIEKRDLVERLRAYYENQ